MINQHVEIKLNVEQQIQEIKKMSLENFQATNTFKVFTCLTSLCHASSSPLPPVTS